MSVLSSKLEGEEGRESVDALAQLRDLLLGEDMGRLQELARRLDDPQVRAAEIAPLLPDSLALSARDQARLVDALRAPVGACIKESIQRDTHSYADALFPVMGPAIRRAIAEALKGLLDSVNRMMDQSLSPRSLAWRWEAYRSGRSFSEVALSHTLVYRVEHAFLIQPDSGLLIAHAEADGAGSLDSDAVSAMLTAIADFVRDAFARGQEGQLERVEHGERDVMLFYGPLATLAVVVRGEAPPELRERFYEVIEGVHRDYRERLEAFDGDRAGLEGVDAALESCLMQRFAQSDKGASKGASGSRRKAWWVLGSVAVLLAVWMGFQGYSAWRQADFERRLAAFVEALDARPGYALSRVVVDQEDGSARAFGFADALADPYADLLQTFGFDAATENRLRLSLEPYQSLDPQMVLRRARRALAPPQGVTLDWGDDGRLRALGVASAGWIERARLLSSAFVAAGGGSGLDLSGVEPLQDVLLRRIKARLLPPDSITLALLPAGDGRFELQVSGEARRSWLQGLPQRLSTIEHLSGVNSHAAVVWEQRVLSELQALLAPPEGVRLGFEDGRLSVSGVAPESWIAKLGETVATYEPVKRLDTHDLQPLDGALLAQVNELLQPGAGVIARVDQRRLSLEGQAPAAWIHQARERLQRQDLGLDAWTMDALKATERLDLERDASVLQSLSIDFEVDSAQIDSAYAERLDRMAGLIVALEANAKVLDQALVVALLGQTDGRGSMRRNAALRGLRAEAVRDSLVQRGVSKGVLRLLDQAQLDASVRDRLLLAGPDASQGPKADLGLNSGRRVVVLVLVESGV